MLWQYRENAKVIGHKVNISDKVSLWSNLLRNLCCGFPIDMCVSRLLTIKHPAVIFISFKSHSRSQTSCPLTAISDLGLTNTLANTLDQRKCKQSINQCVCVCVCVCYSQFLGADYKSIVLFWPLFIYLQHMGFLM